MSSGLVLWPGDQYLESLTECALIGVVPWSERKISLSFEDVYYSGLCFDEGQNLECHTGCALIAFVLWPGTKFRTSYRMCINGTCALTWWKNQNTGCVLIGCVLWPGPNFQYLTGHKRSLRMYINRICALTGGGAKILNLLQDVYWSDLCFDLGPKFRMSYRMWINRFCALTWGPDLE